MSIEYSVIMESDDLTSEILLGEFSNLGYTCTNVIRLEKGIAINQFQELLGFTVYITEAGEYPYNNWDTMFLNHEFEFKKRLSFSLENNFENIEISYTVMLAIIFNVVKQLKTNAIFLGNGGNDLCLFTKQSVLYLNNQKGLWDKPYFKDVVVNLNAQIFTGSPLKI